MRVAYIADVHVANHKVFGGALVSGVNRRCRLVLDALQRAVEAAVAADADALVVAGDLFDSMRPEPQIIAEVQRAFFAYATAARPGAQVIVVPGNHDAANAANADFAVGPLAVAATTVPTAPMITSWGCAVVPYAPGRAAEWLRTGLDALAGGASSLVTHAGVADDDTPPFLRGAHDAVEAAELLDLMAAHGLSAAFCGNWHPHRSWQDAVGARHIVQIGALAPTGFNNPTKLGEADPYGSLVLHDVGAGTWQRLVVPGPRFVVLDGWDAGAARGVASQLHALAAAHPPGAVHVQWTVEPDEAPIAVEFLADAELMYGLGGVRVVPRKDSVVQQRAASAASAALAAADPRAALEAYLASVALPPTVDRDAVRAAALAVLSRAT